MFNKFDNNRGGGNFGPRQMVQLDPPVKCFQEGCTVMITELPFTPARDEKTGELIRPIYCREHYKKPERNRY